MSRPARKPRVLGMVLLAIAWTASAGVQVSIQRAMSQYGEAPELLWVHSGGVLKRLSFGHDGLLADIYWTRAVQYFGGRLRDHKTDFSLLAPLLNIAVTLDPHLLTAYYFGAFFLSAPSPRGAGQPQEAVALLQQGIEANPEEWRLWHHLGFIYYWELKNYPAAAAAYEEGSKNPNAQPWMKVMAAVILEKGGTRDTSRFLWTETLNSSADPTIRENAKAHLEVLKAADDVDELKKRARRFREKTGRWPQSFEEMRAQGFLARTPMDPRGYPYRLQPDGNVAVHPDSPVQMLIRAPSPPGTPAAPGAPLAPRF